MPSEERDALAKNSSCNVTGYRVQSAVYGGSIAESKQTRTDAKVRSVEHESESDSWYRLLRWKLGVLTTTPTSTVEGGLER